MGLPDSSHMAKSNALFACATFIVYIVGFASPNWLTKDFDYPLNKGGVVALPIKANVGLFTACKIETYSNNKTNANCSPEGAADWQYASAALAVIGLVFGLIGLLLSVLSLVSKRLAGKMKIKMAILFCHFIACDVIVAPLIMFPINKTIVVSPSISDFHVDFDLGWSYILAAVSAGMYAWITLLNIVDLIWSHNEEKLSG